MATFTLKAGKAYRLADGGTWEMVAAPGSEVGNTNVHTPVATIDDAPCVVFQGTDRALYAQTLAMAIDGESISIGTEHQAVAMGNDS